MTRRVTLAEWAETAGRERGKVIADTFGEFTLAADLGDAPERARRYVAANARDADDARMLLDALGLR